MTPNRPKAWRSPNCQTIRKHDCTQVSSIWGLGSAVAGPKPAAILWLCPTTNNSLALPRLQRPHNSQSIRMRGAILQITVNNNLPPSAPLPSLKQCFIASLFFFSSASVIPEVQCLISPHQSLPPRGRVDLLIGSCDQTYGRTRHRPQLPGDKSRLVGFFAPALPAPRSRGAEEPGLQRRGESNPIRPLDVARCKRISPAPRGCTQCKWTVFLNIISYFINPWSSGLWPI